MASVPATQTSIVNQALAELGSTEIITSTDIDTSSNSAQRALQLWDGIVRDLIVSHPWNFAIRRVDLNEAGGDALAFGYQRRFNLPNDCARWLPAAEASRDWRRAEREGNQLLADCVAPFPCRYIAMIDDPVKWPPAFSRAVMLTLAAAMAEGVTQSQSIKDRLLNRAEDQLRKAKRIDGFETGNRRRGSVIGRSDWLRARSRGHSALGR